MAKIGTLIDGKYEVLREIGRGGMSVVYLAMDTRLNKQWAIKEIARKANDANNEIVVKSARNIPGVNVLFANLINVYDILNAKSFVVDKAALTKIEEVFAS